MLLIFDGRVRLSGYYSARVRASSLRFNCAKASRDIFSFRDESFEESDYLPDLDILAWEIVDDFEAALGQFRDAMNLLSFSFSKDCCLSFWSDLGKVPDR